MAFILAYNKNKLRKILDYWFRDVPNFDFLEMDLGVVFYHILRIIFCFPGYDIINFQISLIFLIKSFFWMTKNSGQRFKYLVNKKSFYGEVNNTFHDF